MKIKRSEMFAAYKLHNKARIPFSVFSHRVDRLDWDFERAGSETYVPKSPADRRLYAIHKGFTDPVHFEMFRRRVKREGMPLYEAAFTPPNRRQELYDAYLDYPNALVPYRVFYIRVHEYGWDYTKAALTPSRGIGGRKPAPHDGSFYGIWYHENRARAAVGYKIFIMRVKKMGWDKEKALTTLPPEENTLGLKERFDLYPHKNKVCYTTFYARMTRLGWDFEKAISTPKRWATDPRPRSQRPQLYGKV